MIRQYPDLSKAEKESLRIYLQDIFKLPHPDQQAMDEAICSPLYADGRGMFVYVEYERVLGIIGVISKEIETKGELYLIWLSAVGTHEDIVDELLEVALAYATAMRPKKIRLGVAPHFAHLQDRVEKHRFYMKDQAVILGKSARQESLPGQYHAVPLTVENKELYLELRNPSFLATPNSEILTEVDVLERIAEQSGDLCGIFYEGEQPVGVYQVAMKDKVGSVEEVAVAIEQQGKGYGDALITFAENLLVDKGARSIELLVFTSNRSAMALYEKHGYARKKLVSTWFDYVGAGSL